MTEATAGDGKVQLAWESIAGADSYTVKRATAEVGPYQSIADNIAANALVDTEVVNGTTYFYVVSASINGQQTPDSGPLAATPAGKPKTVSWNYDRFGTLSSANTAGVEPVANWNNSWPANPLTDLMDETGIATTLDLSYSSFNTWSVQGSTPSLDADGTANKRLLNGYLSAGPAPWNPWTTNSSVTLSQIPHGYYDIIVYFSSDVAGREGSVTDGTATFYFSSLGPNSISSSNAMLARTTSTSTSDYPAANYAVFAGLVGESQTLIVQMRDNDEWGGIAGFQIIPKPDPISDARLQIQLGSPPTTAMITWPPGLGETVLQESPDLANWELADPQPQSDLIIVPIDRNMRFYRLSRP